MPKMVEGKGNVRSFYLRKFLWRTFILLLAVAFFVLGALVFTTSYSSCLLRSLVGPLPLDDPELLTYLKDEVIDPPSSDPYNLSGQDDLSSKYIEPSEVFYKEKISTLFRDVRNGFFVEAGALDGEAMSNTLALEIDRGWTGLLVEPDAKNYRILRTKNRRAWSANVCLSPKPYPSVELFSEVNHNPGPLAVGLGAKMRSMHSLAEYTHEKVIGNTAWFLKVQCVPLESLLLAIKVTKIDLLVLDVEGAEMDILSHFDLQKFNVQVLCLEWKHVKEMDVVSSKLAKRGYVEVARRHEDIILVKEDSPYLRILQEDKDKDKQNKD